MSIGGSSAARIVWDQLGAVPAGAFAGAICGALVGGVLGRLVMRLAFLIDKTTDGAKTDFGTIGDVTVTGSLTLVILTTIAGTLGGLLYVGVRRWLPFAGIARGASFGALVFVPGLVTLGEVDLRIIEPALPVFAMFVGLFTLYSICVALLIDRLHPARPVRPGPRMDRATAAAQILLAIGIAAAAVLATCDVHEHGGSCFSADQNGGCIEGPD